jgi:DNA modification methylase
MAMFPPSIPHFFIRWLTQPGDVVYDPFSGRGTTVLEACLLGRKGLGSDANPLAWTLTAAKSNPPSIERAKNRIGELRKSMQLHSTLHVPEKIRMLFHPSTLSQLVSLQDRMSLLRGDDRFIYAVLLGILHANARSDGTPRGLTVSMPNTFAMAPNYVKKYIQQHRLRAQNIDVLSAVATRMEQLELPTIGFKRGSSWMQDVSETIEWPRKTPKAKLIFASPPYLQVMKYGKLNWIRLWLLGYEPTAVDSGLFTSASLPRYLEFMSSALKQIKRHLRADGYICLVIGDVRGPKVTVNLANEVAQHCVDQSGLRILKMLDDHLPVKHKVSRIWGETRGRATKTDRILILGGPKARRLPAFPKIDWLSSNCYGEKESE